MGIELGREYKTVRGNTVIRRMDDSLLLAGKVQVPLPRARAQPVNWKSLPGSASEADFLSDVGKSETKLWMGDAASDISEWMGDAASEVSALSDMPTKLGTPLSGAGQ